MRGVVVNLAYQPLSDSTFQVGTVDHEFLKRTLIYWDKIDWPRNNLVFIDGSGDIDYLISEGVLQRTKVNFQGAFSGNLAPVFAQSQLTAFEYLERYEPGVWSLAQPGWMLQVQQLEVPKQRARTLEVDLMRCLPVPAHPVPYADILDFKERRADELFALHSAINAIRTRIETAPDLERAKLAEFEHLERELSALNEVMRESVFGVQLASLRIQYTLPKALEDAIRGGGVAFACGVDPFSSLTVAAASAAFSGLSR